MSKGEACLKDTVVLGDLTVGGSVTGKWFNNTIFTLDENNLNKYYDSTTQELSIPYGTKWIIINVNNGASSRLTIKKIVPERGNDEFEDFDDLFINFLKYGTSNMLLYTNDTQWGFVYTGDSSTPLLATGQGKNCSRLLLINGRWVLRNPVGGTINNDGYVLI